MDPLYSKAQRQIGDNKSKSSRTTRSKRKKKGRSRENEQSAGQVSGPATSGRRRARAAEADERQERSGSVRSAQGDSLPLGNKCAGYTVALLHVLDFCLGISLIVYGALVSVSPVTATAVAYGLFLVLGSVLGALGYFSDVAERKGLHASALTGGLLCLIDIAAFVSIFVSWPTFIAFLNEHAEDLLLTSDAVSTIDGLKVLFAAIFICLAGLEVHRTITMWSLRETMLQRDGHGARRMSPSSSSSCCPCLSWLGLSKKRKTDDFVVFDDDASLESSLLWSKEGTQPSSEDYLDFVPEHERGLADYTSNVNLPEPKFDDRMDY